MDLFDGMPLKVSELLFDDRLLEENYIFTKEKLFVMLVLMRSMRKINQKWNLREQRLNNQGELYELLDLVVDNVITKENLAELLGTETPDLATIAGLLNQRQQNIYNKQGYEILREINKEIQEIKDVEEWLSQSEASTTNFPSKRKYWVLKFGQFAAAAEQNVIPVELTGNLNNALSNCLLGLWLQGADINWEKICTEETFKKVSLPVYAFDRKRHWIPQNKAKKYKTSAMDIQSTKKIIKHFIADDAVIKAHLITGKNIIPGASMIEFALDSIQQSVNQSVNTLKNVVILNPGVVEDQRSLEFEQETNNAFLIKSSGSVLCRGNFNPQPEALINQFLQIKDVKQQQVVDIQNVYPFLFRKGYQYGEALRVIKNIWRIDEKYIIEIKEAQPDNKLSAIMLDGIIQAAIAVDYLEGNLKEDNTILIPYSIKSISIYDDVRDNCFVVINKTDILRNGKDILAKLEVFNAAGKPVLSLDGLILKSISNNFLAKAPKSVQLESNELFNYQPVWIEEKLVAANCEKSASIAVIFTDNLIGDQLYNLIKEKYQQVFVVEKGEDFSQTTKTILQLINYMKQII